MEKKNRVNEISYNSYGRLMKIINYYGNRNIIVEFNNGYKTKVTYQQFQSGMVNNPYDKSVYNKGYIGEGNYLVKDENNIKTLQYLHWGKMLQRCYDNKLKNRSNTYIDVICCDEWLNFQNFGRWFDENYYTINDETIELDKDILYKGNKIYSPKTCVFVPHRINGLFTKSNKSRGDYPIGVHYAKKDGIYISQCTILSNNKKIKKYIGSYKTPEDAFYLGYKPFKEKYIKQVAEEYKNFIPKELYIAMNKYKVEITD